MTQSIEGTFTVGAPVNIQFTKCIGSELYVNNGAQILVWKCGTPEVAAQAQQRICDGLTVRIFDAAIDVPETLPQRRLSLNKGTVILLWDPEDLFDLAWIDIGLAKARKEGLPSIYDYLRHPSNYESWDTVKLAVTASRLGISPPPASDAPAAPLITGPNQVAANDGVSASESSAANTPSNASAAPSPSFTSEINTALAPLDAFAEQIATNPGALLETNANTGSVQTEPSEPAPAASADTSPADPPAVRPSTVVRSTTVGRRVARPAFGHLGIGNRPAAAATATPAPVPPSSLTTTVTGNLKDLVAQSAQPQPEEDADHTDGDDEPDDNEADLPAVLVQQRTNPPSKASPIVAVRAPAQTAQVAPPVAASMPLIAVQPVANPVDLALANALAPAGLPPTQPFAAVPNENPVDAALRNAFDPELAAVNPMAPTVAVEPPQGGNAAAVPVQGPPLAHIPTPQPGPATPPLQLPEATAPAEAQATETQPEELMTLPQWITITIAAAAVVVLILI